MEGPQEQRAAGLKERLGPRLTDEEVVDEHVCSEHLAVVVVQAH